MSELRRLTVVFNILYTGTNIIYELRGGRGRDRMVNGKLPIQPVPITTKVVSSNLWVRISIRVRCTTLCDKVCQWLATGQWFSPGPPVSSTNKTHRHDITEILLKVALNTIKQAKNIYEL